MHPFGQMVANRTRKQGLRLLFCSYGCRKVVFCRLKIGMVRKNEYLCLEKGGISIKTSIAKGLPYRDREALK